MLPVSISRSHFAHIWMFSQVVPCLIQLLSKFLSTFCTSGYQLSENWDDVCYALWALTVFWEVETAISHSLQISQVTICAQNQMSPYIFLLGKLFSSFHNFLFCPWKFSTSHCQPFLWRPPKNCVKTFDYHQSHIYG